MGFTESVIFYVVVGLAVAVAVYMHDDAGGADRTFRVATAVFFWPLYLPVLLARPQPELRPRAESLAAEPDDMAGAIAQVEAELDAALSSLDGWAEDVLAREKERIQELRTAWNAQAARIREMDRLLAMPESAQVSGPALLAGDSAEPVDRRRQSELARLKNIERLRAVRRRAHEDLMGTLAWVRELVSMIHLAKFTGAPASRAEELVAQVAAAVEGISAVTWQETAPVLAEQE